MGHAAACTDSVMHRIGTYPTTLPRHPQVQEATAAALRNLAGGTDQHRQAIADAGAILRLVKLLDSSSVEVQQQAAAALCSLAAGTDQHKQAIAAEGAIPRLVNLLDSSSAAAQVEAAEALSNLESVV